MIVIVDYGMGNLHSVQKAFKRVGADAVITNDAGEIVKADKIILPGVGHFKKGMENLQKLGLIEILNKKVLKDGVPFLGICLGAQLITRHSEEGDAVGLSWVNAKTLRFDADKKLKIPHMGWNSISIKKKSDLLNGLDNDSQFYFVHSYYIECENNDEAIGITSYGREFVCALQKGNIYGVQFHPEKSHDSGLRIIKNFLNMGR